MASPTLPSFRYRLEQQPPHSPEVGIIRTYLEWLTELPWAVETTDQLALKNAKKILDEDQSRAFRGPALPLRRRSRRIRVLQGCCRRTTHSSCRCGSCA